MLNLQAASKKCIFDIESDVVSLQLPFEKENTFSVQFAEKVVDLYLQPLRVNIDNADLDRSEFEIRQSDFFKEESEKSRLEKEEFRRTEGLEEDLRHENEVKGLNSFFQQLIDQENEIHTLHRNGRSTDMVLEELVNQSCRIETYLKQRQQDLQRVKAKRLEALKQREIEEKKKKEVKLIVFYSLNY